jgi:chromosome segregation ATPase
MNPEWVIRIIVRARNEIAGVLDKAAGDVDKVTKASERQATQAKKTEQASRDLRREYEEFTASVKRGEKDTDAAVFGLRRLSGELDKMAKARPIGDPFGEELNKAAVSARTQIAQIQELQRARAKYVNDDIAASGRLAEQRIKDSAGQRTLRNDVERTIARFDEFQASVERGQIKSEHARVGYRQFGNELGTLSRKFEAGSDDAIHLAERSEYAAQRAKALGGTLRQAGQEAERTGGFFRRLLSNDFTKIEDWNGYIRRLEARLESSSFSVAKLDNRLRGLLVAAVFAFFQQLVSVAGALAGTLISVASAAIQAGEALGGALAAGAAQAIPLVGLLVAAWGRVGAVFKAVQQAQKDAVRSAQEHQQAATGQANAADRVRSAQQALADAHRRVTEAQLGLTKARRDAQRQLEDLIATEQRARAEMSDAERQQRRDIESGNVDAEVANQQRVAQSRLAAQRASQDLGLARAGDPTAGPNATLHSAQKALDDATRGVSQARQQLASAKQDATDAAEKLTGAHALLEGMLKQLDPTERRLYEAMRRVQDTYRATFRPITDIIVAGFTDAANRINKVMTDSRVVGPLTRLAGQVRTQMGRIVADLTSNRALNFFKLMADQARENLPTVTNIFLHLEHIFENIAKAGSPALHAFLDFLDQLVAKGDASTGSDSGIARLTIFFMRGEQFAEQIIHLGGAIAHLFGALIGASAESGATAIEDLTIQINKATAWIQAHQEKVRQFFEGARKATYEVASAVWDLLKAFAEVYNTNSVHELTKAFSNVLLPVLVTVTKAMGAFTGLILKFMGTGIGGKISQLALTMIILNKAFSPILTLFGSAIVRLGELAFAFGRVRTAAILAEGGVALLRVATGPLGIAISAVAAVILLLNEKFHFLHHIADAVKSVFQWFGDLVGHNPFLEIMGGVVALTGAIVGLRKAIEVLKATQLGSSLLGGLGGGLLGRGAGGAAGRVGGRVGTTALEDAVAASTGAGTAAGGGALAGAGARAAGVIARGLGGALAHAPIIAAGAAVVDSVIESFKTGSVSQGAMRGLSNVASTLSFGLIPKPKDFDKQDKIVTDDIDRIQALATEKAKAHKLGINIDVNLAPGAKDRVNKFLDDLIAQLDNTVTATKKKTETWSGYLDEMTTNVGLNMKRITYLLQQGRINQGEATQAIAANYNQAANSINKSMRDAGRVTKAGLELMNKYFRQALKSYGMSEADITQELAIRDYRAAHPGGGTGAQGQGVQGGTGSATLATGGWVGSMGERGRDAVNTWLGRGEAVLNWAHQKAIAPALAWAKEAGVSAYGSLNEVFSHVRGYHAGGWSAPGLAAGGPAGGDNLFNGHPSNVADGVRQLIQLMKRRFPLSVSSTTDHSLYTTSGNVSDHSTGHAVDLTGSPDVMLRAADWVKSSGLYRQLKQGIHNPNLAVNAGKIQTPPGQFAGAVWQQHLSHIHLAIAHALGAVAGGDVMTRIRRLVLEGPDSIIKTTAQRGLDIARRGANRMLRRAASQAGADTSGDHIDTHGLHGPWVGVLEQIARQRGWSIPDWKWIVGAESGGDPEAVNKSSGAFGLGQFLGSTLRSYAKYGATSHDPIKQIEAMAQYILDRYINPTRAKSFHLAHNWYAAGGELPGPLGKAIPIVAHAREWILPEHMQHKLASWVGTTRDQLKSRLGFTGGPTSYQGGGEPTAHAARSARVPTFTLPANYDASLGGLVDLAKRAFKFMDGLRLRSKNFLTSFRSAFQEMAGQGGIFDQMSDALTRLVKHLAVQLKRATYKMDKFGRVLLQGTDVSRAEAAVTNLETTYGALMDEKGAITGTLKRITERIHRLRKGGISAKERATYDRLMGYQRNLRTRLEDLQSDIADNLEEQYNAVEAALQAQVDATSTKVGRTTRLVDLQSRARAIVGTRVAGATGMRGPQELAQQQAEAMQIQVGELTATMNEATRQGHYDLAQKIADQIDEVNMSIAEIIQKGLNDAIDEANARAQHAQAGLDLRGRLADLMEKAGDAVGAFAERGRILAARGTNLLQQQSDLTSLRDQAAAQGQTAVVDQLNDQLAELAVTIQENTAAIQANIVAMRQAAIDAITHRGGFLTGVFGGLGGLLTAMAANTGIVDINRQKALLGQIGTTLGQTGSGLREQLLAGYGIDVRGLGSTQLVDVLRKLDYDGIEANFSQEQKTQFENLINSIIENATAVESNTDQIKQLTSPTAQSWSSTAWQWFRNAIFTGAGGLLPQYQIPHMDVGGYIRSDGLIYAHQGERVMAANVEYGNNGTSDVFAPHVENHEKTVDMDTETMVNRLMFSYKNRSKS